MFPNRNANIGKVDFAYSPAPPLTGDVRRAILSDPNANSLFRLELGCDKCNENLYIYTALEQDRELEAENHVWQNNAPAAFQCECGSVNYSLQYVKESLHGFLNHPLDRYPSNQFAKRGEFERHYSHSVMLAIADGYRSLLDKETLEAPFQSFIEKNLSLLARYRATRIFVKPNLLGKFQPDFAVIDTQKRLIFIELERPDKLFRKDGHPTQFLNHAYGQVNDWIMLARKHYHAVLDSLSVEESDVTAIRGSVIAGRSNGSDHTSLRAFLERPPYADIDFLTLDDLVDDLVQISQSLQ